MKINPEKLYYILRSEGIEFFTGVPDSTIKSFCFYLEDNLSNSNHVIAANEGNSIAIATGYHLSTGKIPLVYMQNSGFGNALNPLTSLTDKEVFSIPMLVMMGWRGEPGTNDAIQHSKDGKIQIKLLETLGLSYTIFPSEKMSIEELIQKSLKKTKSDEAPHVLLVKRGSFENSNSRSVINKKDFHISRERAISNLIKQLNKEDIVVSTTGKLSRELNEIRQINKMETDRDFLVLGSMGHASSIALGISLGKEEHKIYCIDGDGALIMHMGALSTIGKYSLANFRHILINNFSHDSVGGQATSSDIIDYSLLSKSLSYKNYFKILKEEDFDIIFPKFKEFPGPSLLEIVVSKGSRKDLGRPTNTPYENKRKFMKSIEFK